MAEESGNLLVTPEGTESDGGTRIRNASSSKSGEKVLPHYLRASTGSCHDLCKYGRKHAFEAKARHPMTKRIAKSSIDNQSQTGSMILPKRIKASVVRPKSSPTSKSYSCDAPEIIKHEVSTRSLNCQSVPSTSVDSHYPVKDEVLPGIKKTSASKLRPSPPSKSCLSESLKFNIQELSAKTQVSSKPVKSYSKEKNATQKHASSLKMKSLEQKPLSSPDISGGLNGRRNSDIKTVPPKVVVKKAIASPRLSLASPRASLSPKPSNRRVAMKVMASPRVSQPSLRASLSPKSSTSRVANKVSGSSRVSLAPPRASFSPRHALSRVASLNTRKPKSLKVVSLMKNQSQTKTDEPEESKIELKHTIDDMVQVKTLYVIQMATENRSLESDQNESRVVEPAQPPSCLLTESLPASSSSSSLHNEEQQEISEYTETRIQDACLSESDETFSTEEETMEDEQPRRSRKDGMVYSKEKSSQAMKLHFRRGKVVDVQSDNNSPRRLKFRRGRVLGESPNLKGDGRKSFKKRGSDGVVTASKSSSEEKVVLRHQDVQGRKDSQILFNNVIEQTASKLAETRKSKVKALVGAFETVISLQEIKPSANTA